MSIDNLNAEHRVQFDVLPPPIRRQQCCSFCRRPGHNLTTCNSNRLREFEVICANQVLETDTRDDFKNWLIQNYISEHLLIKTFAIKKFRVTTRASVDNCMDMITQYIFMNYKENNENVEIIEEENNFANDLMIFMQELSNIRQEEIQESRTISENQQVRAMENILMREMFIAIMTGIVNRTIIDEYKKLRIKSTFNNNENEDICQLCECSICYDEKELQNFVKLGCNHEFCKDCVINTIKTSNNKVCCAFCRSEVTEIESRTNEVKNEIDKFIQ